MNYRSAALVITATVVLVVGIISAIFIFQKDDNNLSASKEDETGEDNEPAKTSTSGKNPVDDKDAESTKTSEAPPAENKAKPTGAFKVIGKDIVDPDGNIFIPMGANVGGLLYDSADAWVGYLHYQEHDITTAESVAAVKAWGWNTLRLNSQCIGAGPSSDDNHQGWGSEELFESIDPVVEAYTAEKIVVMIDCHAFTGGDPVMGSPEYVQSTEFWKEVAERYGDNPYVWFNHLNEFAAENGQGYWQEVVDDGYKTFVESGAQNIVLFDLPTWGQSLSTMTDPAVVSWAKEKCNVVWDWHSYGGLGTGQDYSEATIAGKADSLLAAVSDADLPLVVGEFGHDWNDSRRATNFNYQAEYSGARAAISLAPKYDYGLLAWHANGDNSIEMKYGLKNNDDLTFENPSPGAELSSWGQLFWDQSQKVSERPVTAGPTDASCTR